MIGKIIVFFFLTISITTYATRYDKIITQLNDIQKQAPDKALVLSLGENNNKDQILMLRISSTPKVMDRNKIAVVAVATHHGNEGQTADIIISLAKELIKEDLGYYEYYLIPVLNIPGYNSNSREENGYDPNRDYPSPCKKTPNFYLKSTKDLDDLLGSRIFSASVTLHGFVGTVTYPWGVPTKDTHTQDHPYFDEITKKIAKIVGYDYGTSTDLIYGANGCFEDYVYWKKGVWSLLFEIKDGSTSDISNNVQAILEFFKSVNQTPSVNYDFTGICEDYSYKFSRLE